MKTLIENIPIQHNYISKNIYIQYSNKPFRYIVIDNLFDDEIYTNVCSRFKSFIDRTVPYKDQPGATSNYEGYISGLSVQDCINGYDFFLSEELKDFTERTFEIKTNRYMSPSAHFHKSPSKNGFIHRDLNICSFTKLDQRVVTNNCFYTDDSKNKQPKSEKVIRSIAFLYYLNNPKDLTNYTGGGTGIYSSYSGGLVTEIKPVNNRLFMFEICHNSFHAFIGANFDRSCVVGWYHSSPAYIINRYWKEYYKMTKNNQNFLERWAPNPDGGYWEVESDPDYGQYFNASLKELLS